MTWAVGDSPEEAFRAIEAELRRVKNRANVLRAASLAGTLSRSDVADFSSLLHNVRTTISTALAVTGLDAYAKGQRGATYTAGEGAARITAINNMQSWICGPTTANPGAATGNFPLSVTPTGFLLEKTFDSNGQWVAGVLTVAQSAGFRTQIDSFLAGLS